MNTNTFEEAKRDFIEISFNKEFRDNIDSITIFKNKEFNEEYVTYAINKAWADMFPINVNNIKNITQNDNNKGACINFLVAQFSKYFESNFPNTFEEFNQRHNDMCDKFIEKLKEYAVDCTYGKVQKIINMTFKYLYCFADAHNYENHFKYCHMPLDMYTLSWYCREISNIMIENWSYITLDLYTAIQKDIRNYINSIPIYNHKLDNVLKAEFIIWQIEKPTNKYFLTKNISEEQIKEIINNIEKRNENNNV